MISSVPRRFIILRLFLCHYFWELTSLLPLTGHWNARHFKRTLPLKMFFGEGHVKGSFFSYFAFVSSSLVGYRHPVLIPRFLGETLDLWREEKGCGPWAPRMGGDEPGSFESGLHTLFLCCPRTSLLGTGIVWLPPTDPWYSSISYFPSQWSSFASYFWLFFYSSFLLHGHPSSSHWK